MKALGERTITIDCDALQADGGTRTWLYLTALRGSAGRHLLDDGKADDQNKSLAGPHCCDQRWDCRHSELLDLCYEEDSRVATDMNIVMTGAGKFVEVQGTAEGDPFSGDNLLSMLKLGHKGIQQLIEMQSSCAFEPLIRP